MLADLWSEAARWIYTSIAVFVITPLCIWWKKGREDKKELMGRVKNLETGLDSLNKKHDKSEDDRRATEANMEAKIDRMEDKVMNRFDKFGDILNEVKINTAINSDRIDR
jgi:type VI protein secretion system component VasK